MSENHHPHPSHQAWGGMGPGRSSFAFGNAQPSAAPSSANSAQPPSHAGSNSTGQSSVGAGSWRGGAPGAARWSHVAKPNGTMAHHQDPDGAAPHPSTSNAAPSAAQPSTATGRAWFDGQYGMRKDSGVGPSGAPSTSTPSSTTAPQPSSGGANPNAWRSTRVDKLKGETQGGNAAAGSAHNSAHSTPSLQPQPHPHQQQQPSTQQHPSSSHHPSSAAAGGEIGYSAHDFGNFGRIGDPNLKWFYLDPQRETQGPFSASDMSAWYHSNYFDLKLPVQCLSPDAPNPNPRSGSSLNFIPLGVWFMHGNKAFLPTLPNIVEQGKGGMEATPTKPVSGAGGLISPVDESSSYAASVHQLVADDDDVDRDVSELERYNSKVGTAATAGDASADPTQHASQQSQHEAQQGQNQTATGTAQAGQQAGGGALNPSAQPWNARNEWQQQQSWSGSSVRGGTGAAASSSSAALQQLQQQMRALQAQLQTLQSQYAQLSPLTPEVFLAQLGVNQLQLQSLSQQQMGAVHAQFQMANQQRLFQQQGVARQMQQIMLIMQQIQHQITQTQQQQQQQQQEYMMQKPGQPYPPYGQQQQQQRPVQAASSSATAQTAQAPSTFSADDQFNRQAQQQPQQSGVASLNQSSSISPYTQPQQQDAYGSQTQQAYGMQQRAPYTQTGGISKPWSQQQVGPSPFGYPSAFPPHGALPDQGVDEQLREFDHLSLSTHQLQQPALGVHPYMQHTEPHQPFYGQQADYQQVAHTADEQVQQYQEEAPVDVSKEDEQAVEPEQAQPEPAVEAEYAQEQATAEQVEAETAEADSTIAPSDETATEEEAETKTKAAPAPAAAPSIAPWAGKVGGGEAKQTVKSLVEIQAEEERLQKQREQQAKERSGAGASATRKALPFNTAWGNQATGLSLIPDETATSTSANALLPTPPSSTPSIKLLTPILSTVGGKQIKQATGKIGKNGRRTEAALVQMEEAETKEDENADTEEKTTEPTETTTTTAPATTTTTAAPTNAWASRAAAAAQKEATAASTSTTTSQPVVNAWAARRPAGVGGSTSTTSAPASSPSAPLLPSPTAPVQHAPLLTIRPSWLEGKPLPSKPLNTVRILESQVLDPQPQPQKRTTGRSTGTSSSSQSRSSTTTSSSRSRTTTTTASQEKPSSESSGTGTASAFGGPTMSADFERWCREKLSEISGEKTPDLTLLQFLMTCGEDEEVREYIHQYLGTGQQVDEFADGFLQLKAFESGATKESGKKKGGSKRNQEF